MNRPSPCSWTAATSNGSVTRWSQSGRLTGHLPAVENHHPMKNGIVT